jgi:hypothetical protein
MASVYIDFVPPDRPGFVKLLIYESPDADGPFVLIETVTEIGTYPNYLTQYSTDKATAVQSFFAIRWEDEKAVQTEMSEAVQGGTESLVGIVTSRVMLRSSGMSENVVVQETEDVICEYMGSPIHTQLTHPRCPIAS